MTWSEFVELPEEDDWPLLAFVAQLLVMIAQMPDATAADREARKQAWRDGIKAFEHQR